jgi:hypothetical protein
MRLPIPHNRKRYYVMLLKVTVSSVVFIAWYGLFSLVYVPTKLLIYDAGFPTSVAIGIPLVFFLIGALILVRVVWRKVK